MKRISLERKVHKGADCLLFRFEKDREFIQVLRAKIPSLKWSQTMNCWYTSFNQYTVSDLFSLFRGIAFLDYSQLRKSDSSVVSSKDSIHKNIERFTSDTHDNLNQFKQYLGSAEKVRNCSDSKF